MTKMNKKIKLIKNTYGVFTHQERQNQTTNTFPLQTKRTYVFKKSNVLTFSPTPLRNYFVTRSGSRILNGGWLILIGLQ